MDRREMNRSIFQDTERMCKTDAELSAVTKISVANQRFIAERSEEHTSESSHDRQSRMPSSA